MQNFIHAWPVNDARGREKSCAASSAQDRGGIQTDQIGVIPTLADPQVAGCALVVGEIIRNRILVHDQQNINGAMNLLKCSLFFILCDRRRKRWVPEGTDALVATNRGCSLSAAVGFIVAFGILGCKSH